MVSPMARAQFHTILGTCALLLCSVGTLACKGDGGSGAGASSTGGGGAAETGGSGGTGATSSGGSGGEPGVQCGPGTELCGDSCTVTTYDPNNCGGCGNACDEGQVCDGGTCALECSGGATQCGASCVDTNVDPAHCGACDAACDSEQEICSSGACVPACGSGGLVKCGDACIDTMSDANHCGQCGSACAGAEACVAGACVAKVAPAAVYTMTNDVAGNKILSFARAEDGSLSPTGTFTATGGVGTGAGLGNQHGLIFDQEKKLFFVVNAGDDSISMLRLEVDGSLSLLSNVKSGGVRPVSVTASGDVVYVVNAGAAASGASANISGFEIMGDALAPIAGSTQPLSAANPGPAQIQFSPDGTTLVVTEKATNVIDTYKVTGGVAGAPIVKASAGVTPFGFDFTADQLLLVSEAAGGMPSMSTTSSYSLAPDGTLTTVSGAVPSTRTAACWLVVAGDHAYVANAQTNDITGFDVAPNGSLSLLNADGVTGQTSGGATDEDVSDDGQFLYVVSAGAHVFSVFRIEADGSLTKKPDFVGLPTGVNGIVAR